MIYVTSFTLLRDLNVKTNIDIYQFQVGLGKRLIQWGSLSAGLGVVTAVLGSPFWRGLGIQFAGWGIIDALIGWLGLRSGRRKAAEPGAHSPEIQAKERTNSRRVLAINTGLDVLYVGGGIKLAHTKGRDHRFWRGTGIGIAIQGGFLLLFDLAHIPLLGYAE